MSIVKYVKNELPTEGGVVYCDNGTLPSDRAVFKDGNFIGGGEQPRSSYNMISVNKWFYIDLYDKHHKDKGDICYFVSFNVAETIPPT